MEVTPSSGRKSIGSLEVDGSALETEEAHGVHNREGRCCLFRAKELESVSEHHHYSESEMKRMRTMESIDYLPQNSYVYRQWLRNEGKPSGAFTWGMYALVGFSIGVLGFVVKNLIFILTEFRMHHIKHAIENNGIFEGWLISIAISISFVLVASVAITFGAPEAAGSGLPEVIAYLNGVRVRYIFNFRICILKFISVIFAVSSGLPVGPEGPMVHLGAALGKGISQGRLTKQFDQYQTAQQRRNFLSAGAAAGIGKFIVNSKLPYVAGLTGKTVLINTTFINYTSCRLWKPCWRHTVRYGRSCILLEYAIDMANLLLCNGSDVYYQYV